MPHPLLASRRTAVAVGTVTLVPALGVVVSGCDAAEVGDLLPGGSRPDDGSGVPAGPDPDDDESLVDEAVTEVAAQLALVAAVQVRHPRLRAPLADLEALHVAHLAALEGDQAGPAAPPTAGATAALTLVRRRAARHQRRLADLAVRADSGQLARLLASMAAAVAQHLVALPRRQAGTEPRP